MAGTAIFTTALRTFEKFQRSVEAEAESPVWRSTYIIASEPIISAIENVPTDQGSLEAVLGFILAGDSVPRGTEREAWGCEPLTGADPHSVRVLPPRAGASPETTAAH
jgi:hypothetical protein